MSQPLVSAIVSTYNSELFIRGRIENLLGQTIADQIEIIIVNSGSEENESKIIKEFLEKYVQIKYIETKDRETIYKAWNRAIKISKGKYITNANTDDRLREDALKILADTLNKNPDKALVYADQYITNVPNQSFALAEKDRKFDRIDYTRFKLYSEFIPGPQSMWRASLHFEDNIWFDESFEVSGDNDFVCKIAEKYDLMMVHNVLGIYYKASDNTNKEFRNFKETYKEGIFVRDKYARRYIASLNAKELNRLRILMRFARRIPRAVIYLIRKILSIIKPNKQIPPRIYYNWLGSIIEETKGNINRAIKYCKPFLRNERAHIIHYQYRHLTKKSP
jgi:glycosyltransferase involved in cell wall biosynthesis